MTTSKKRARSSNPGEQPHPADIIRDLDRETVTLNGDKISMLEAGIRLLYARSLKGDIRASVDLQRTRDRCGADSEPRPAGCLVVPEDLPLDEWERRAAEQQRPYREAPYLRGEL